MHLFFTIVGVLVGCWLLFLAGWCALVLIGSAWWKAGSTAVAPRQTHAKGKL